MCRGSGSDPIVFHVRENLADALIGQLIFHNITNDDFRSHKGRAPTFSPPDPHRERFINSHFTKNATQTQFMPMLDMSRRRNRDVTFDENFYVSVMPRIYYDDNIAEESEFVPLKRKFMPSKTNRPNRRNYTSLSRSAAVVMKPRPFTTKQTTVSPTETTESIDDDMTTVTTDQAPEVVHVTPRSRMPKSRTMPPHMYAKDTQMNSNINDKNNASTSAARPDHYLKRTRSREEPPLPKKELKFFIANQHDVAGLIRITNDGTLMTVKPLDREENAIYRLTVIAEFKQGYMSGAGIYQVIIHVDDVNDCPPKFNLHSYSGTITENSPVGTEVLLDQEIMVTDADVGDNAKFTVSLIGEGSQMFMIETINNNNYTRPQRPSKKPDSVHRVARAASLPTRKSTRRRPATNSPIYSIGAEQMKPQYIVKYVGPNVIDRELQSFYELRLLAKDKGGLGSEVKMTIYVNDVNDNAPMFEKIAVFKDMGLEILEYTNDLEIYFIERQVPDALTYPIRHHMIDPEKLVSSASNYEIMQFAESSNIGTPRLMGGPDVLRSNETELVPKRRMRRKNNDKPYPMFSIPESVEAGSNILKLTAVDEDYEENAQLAYGIVSETLISPKATPKRINASKYFGIDSLSGELRVQRPLPAQTEILLNISAIDTGGLTDFTIIKFKVSFHKSRLCFFSKYFDPSWKHLSMVMLR